MKRRSKFLSLLISLVLALSLGLTACVGGGGGSTGGDDDEGGRGGSGKTSITFWYNGNDVEQTVFQGLVNTFNNSPELAGDKWKVQATPQSDMAGAIGGRLGTSSCPDVFYVGDGDYKKYVEADYLYNITEFVNASTKANPADMWDSIYDRYFYSTKNHRSGAEAEDGQWYGLPKDIGPTVIFYNEDLFEAAGVTTFSLAEEDLAAFNAGTKADDRGQTKSQLGFTQNVPAKGYFVQGEAKYFNNQIAMSWEEVRVLAALISKACTEKDDAGKVTKQVYGYHTEWWFAYGWSVGGDCIQFVDATGTADENNYDGNGFYDFTLVDDTKNFIVAPGKSFSVNGNNYAAGETISYQDKLTNEYDLAGENNKHSLAEYDETVLAAVTSGTLQELPSQREAFVEFVLLSAKSSVEIDGKNGYEVTPTPSSMGGDSAKAEEFVAGKIAMLVDGRWNVTNFRDTDKVGFDWDVAPLPIYKEYDGDTVTVKGKEAGHSGSVALAMNSKIASKKIEGAWKFIEFLAGEDGQKAQSLSGFAIPSQKALAMSTNNGPNGGGVFLNQLDESGNPLKPLNAKIFIRAALNEGEGDWAYTKTGNAWITDWAGDLNGPVRNGEKTFEEFINGTAYQGTYAKLKEISVK